MDYITERLDGQIQWYSKKAKGAKRVFITLSIIQLSLTAAIPIAAILLDAAPIVFKIIISVLGTVATVITGILNLLKFQESWAKYRIAKESLVSEKISYLFKTDYYRGIADQKDLESILVANCEEIMRKEREGWYVIPSRKSEEDKTND